MLTHRWQQEMLTHHRQQDMLSHSRLPEVLTHGWREGWRGSHLEQQTPWAVVLARECRGTCSAAGSWVTKYWATGSAEGSRVTEYWGTGSAEGSRATGFGTASTATPAPRP